MSKATLHAKLKEPEYRHEFVSANIDTGLAFQIRALREQRKWSQQELGRRIGRKPGQEQPGISKLETAGHAFSLATLKKLAEAFDVALVVRFVPFSEAANWVSNLGPGSLEVASFPQDRGFDEVRQATSTLFPTSCFTTGHEPGHAQVMVDGPAYFRFTQDKSEIVRTRDVAYGSRGTVASAAPGRMVTIG